MAKRRANGEGMVRKRADGRWEARYTDPREIDHKKRVKQIIRKTQKEVVEQLKAALAEISDKKPLLSNENPTISEWMYLWMTEYKIGELRDTTYETYMRNINQYINPTIGNIKIKDLKGIQIQNLYNVLQKDKKVGGYGLGEASVVKVRNILSGALQQAMANHMLRDNPMDGTKPPKVNDPDIRILSKEEEKQFTAVLPFFNTGNMFALSLATGMRIGEVCGLDRSDINRTEKYINISKTAIRSKDKYTGDVAIKTGPPKTKYSNRRIPLLPSVEVILDRQEKLLDEMKQRALIWKENNLVFPTDEGNIHDKSGMRSSMIRILKRAGLPHMTIHSLRHTYATTALNTGVSAQNVARCLGHKDGATTLRFYAHYINSEAVAQLDSLEGKNISHHGITESELQKVISRSDAEEKLEVAERINTAIKSAKYLSYKKGVFLVLNECENILCEPLENLSSADKDTLLTTLSQYTFLKRNCTNQKELNEMNIDEDEGIELSL